MWGIVVTVAATAGGSVADEQGWGHDRCFVDALSGVSRKGGLGFRFPERTPRAMLVLRLNSREFGSCISESARNLDYNAPETTCRLMVFG